MKLVQLAELVEFVSVNLLIPWLLNMATIKRFEDLDCWASARRFVGLVYQLTRKQCFQRDLDLIRQIRRSAVSSMANIAEGFGRRTDKEFRNLLAIANGSALELQSHLHIAFELKYIDEKQFEERYEQAKSVSRLIGGFINYLSK